MGLRDVLREITRLVVDADERLPKGEFISLDYSEKQVRLYHFTQVTAPLPDESPFDIEDSITANCESKEQVAELLAWLKAKGEKHE